MSHAHGLVQQVTQGGRAQAIEKEQWAVMDVVAQERRVRATNASIDTYGVKGEQDDERR